MGLCPQNHPSRSFHFCELQIKELLSYGSYASLNGLSIINLLGTEFIIIAIHFNASVIVLFCLSGTFDNLLDTVPYYCMLQTQHTTDYNYIPHIMQQVLVHTAIPPPRDRGVSSPSRKTETFVISVIDKGFKQATLLLLLYRCGKLRACVLIDVGIE